MRYPKWWYVALIAAGLLAVWLLPSATNLWRAMIHPLRFTQSVENGSYFYRLKASYLHGAEPVDFDIVVGCNVTVTSYQDNEKSYEAFRDPNVFAKATQDNGAVMQFVTDACRGQTTANGQVPKDFLPGAIWFDNAKDLTLGIGYVTEDAFENPKSKLKFLGASISVASREEWEAFKQIARQNLVNPRVFSHYVKPPTEAEVKAHLWDKAEMAKWWPAFQCYGVAHYHLTDPAAQRELRTYWPNARPRYWSPDAKIAFDLKAMLWHKNGGALADGLRLPNYFLGHYEGKGFPTRRRGGTLSDAPEAGVLPAKIYPMRADDGLPWASPALTSAETIYRDFEMARGAMQGALYCYSMIPGWEAAGSFFIPNYFDRNFVTRVDGVQIQVNGRPGPSFAVVPETFFENDEYYLLQIIISLS